MSQYQMPPGPGVYIPHEFTPGTETNRPQECAVCRNLQDHVVHLPTFGHDDIEDTILGPVSTSVIPKWAQEDETPARFDSDMMFSLRRLVDEYGLAGLRGALAYIESHPRF